MMASSDPKPSEKCTTWLEPLDRQTQTEHTTFLFTTDAVCVDQSQKRLARREGLEPPTPRFEVPKSTRKRR